MTHKDNEDGPFPEATLQVTRDRMAVLLNCPTMPSELDEFIDWVREELAAREVMPHLLEGIGDTIRGVVAKDEGFHGVAVVEGKQPGPPIDGYIEWGGDFFKAGFLVDEETGALNYRKPAAERNVVTGQLLAAVHPPQPGEDGVDVFGNRVPGKKGRARRLRPGRNIRQEDDRYYAAREGRIQWDQKTLSVDEVLVIHSDVGLKSGDIDHLGTVVVQGDIGPESVVRATGDIEVEGIIEQADVEAGGDLVVEGGIMGRGKDKILVEGRIQAKFIIDAEVEAGHDIVINREIVQSTVKCMASISIPNGRIVGGEIVARAGVLVGQVGSEALVPTVLTAGRDFRLDDKLEILHAEIDGLFTKREQLDLKLQRASKRKRLPMMRPEDLQNGDVPALTEEIKEIDRRIQVLTAEAESLKLQSKSNTRARLEILKVVHPESYLGLGEEQLHVRERFRGPVHAHVSGGKVHLRRGTEDS
ncbi:MAG: FapA family protein [Candidatus Hydrogenedentota bacterium]